MGTSTASLTARVSAVNLDTGNLAPNIGSMRRFGGFPDAGHQRLLGRSSLMEIGATRLGDLGNQEVGQRAVEIVAPEAGVAVGGEHLEDTAVEFENRKVEGAAAQIVHGDFGMLLELVQPIGQSGRRGFIDDAFDLESGQFTGPQRGVALGIVEIRRHGDDGSLHGLTEG